MKIDGTVKKETSYIAVGMLIMSVLMQSVFLVIGKWSIGVLFSNLLIGIVMVVNFFLMCITVQKAVAYDDEKSAKSLMRSSQSMRFLMLVLVLAIGVCFTEKVGSYNVFDFWALFPPLFFNRITVMIRGFTIKDEPLQTPRESEDDAD